MERDFYQNILYEAQYHSRTRKKRKENLVGKGKYMSICLNILHTLLVLHVVYSLLTHTQAIGALQIFKITFIP